MHENVFPPKCLCQRFKIASRVIVGMGGAAEPSELAGTLEVLRAEGLLISFRRP